MKKMGKKEEIALLLVLVIIINIASINAAIYHVTTCNELRNINNGHLNDYVYLDNDIDCSGIANFPMIGYSTSFKGTFDGQCHKITNLKQNSATGGGLFGILQGAVVKNIGIEKANIRTSAWAGGIAFSSKGNSLIENSYFQGTITASVASGIVGSMEYTTIRNCYSSGKLSSPEYLGGVLGIAQIGYQAKIQNSYSAIAMSTINGNSKLGICGTVYSGYGSSVTKTFWDITVSGSSNSGGGIGKTTAGMKRNSTYAGWDTNIWKLNNNVDYPRLICFGCTNDAFCSDNNQCTTDSCDTSAHTCSHTNIPDGDPCIGGQCQGGICLGGCGSNTDCDDSNSCTNDVCDIVARTCSHTTFVDGTPCPGGLCQSGSCSGGCSSNTDCDDLNFCTDDVCDPATFTCSHTNKPNGDSCPNGICNNAICREVKTCSSNSQTILKLFKSTNSHAASYNDVNFLYDICYDEIFGVSYPNANPQLCSSSNKIIGLSQVQDSVAEKKELSNYGTSICYGDLVCRTVYEPNVQLVSYLNSYGSGVYRTLTDAQFAIKGITGDNTDGPIIYGGTNNQKVSYMNNYATGVWNNLPDAPFEISGMTGDNSRGVVIYGGTDNNNVAYLMDYSGSWILLNDAPFEIKGIAGDNTRGPIIYGGINNKKVAYMNSYSSEIWHVLADVTFEIKGITGDNTRGIIIYGGTNNKKVAYLMDYSGGVWNPLNDAPYDIKYITGDNNKGIIIAGFINNGASDCSSDEKPVVRLFQDSDSNVSNSNDITFPIKVCCSSSYSVDPKVYWKNVKNNQINKTDLNDLVKLSVEGGNIDGKAIKYTIYKENSAGNFNEYYNSDIIVVNPENKGSAFWRVNSSGNYFFQMLVIADGDIFSTIMNPDINYRYLTVSNIENDSKPKARIINPAWDSKNRSNVDINFNAIVEDEDDDLIATWDFGDNNRTNIPNCLSGKNCNITHKYVNSRTYLISLQVEEMTRGLTDINYTRLFIFSEGINVHPVISEPMPGTILNGTKKARFVANKSYVAECFVGSCPCTPTTPCEYSITGCYEEMGLNCFNYNNSIGIPNKDYELWFDWNFSEQPGKTGNWSSDYNWVVEFNRSFVSYINYSADIKVGYQDASGPIIWSDKVGTNFEFLDKRPTCEKSNRNSFWIFWNETMNEKIVVDSKKPSANNPSGCFLSVVAPSSTNVCCAGDKASCDRNSSSPTYLSCEGAQNPSTCFDYTTRDQCENYDSNVAKRSYPTCRGYEIFNETCGYHVYDCSCVWNNTECISNTIKSKLDCGTDGDITKDGDCKILTVSRIDQCDTTGFIVYQQKAIYEGTLTPPADCIDRVTKIPCEQPMKMPFFTTLPLIISIIAIISIYIIRNKNGKKKS